MILGASFGMLKLLSSFMYLHGMIRGRQIHVVYLKIDAKAFLSAANFPSNGKKNNFHLQTEPFILSSSEQNLFIF